MDSSDECLPKQYPDLSSLGTKNHILKFSSLYDFCPALRKIFLIPPADIVAARKVPAERQGAKPGSQGHAWLF